MDDEGHKFDQNGQEIQGENQNENQNNQGDGQEARRIEVHEDGQDEHKSLDGMVHGGQESAGDASGDQSEQNDGLGQGYTTLPSSGAEADDSDAGAPANSTFDTSLNDEPAPVVAPTPLSTSKPAKSGKSSVVWIILTALLFLAAAGLGVMYYLQQQGNQSEVDKLNDKVSTLQSQLNADVSDPAISQSTDNQDYRFIPELGVKYKLTDANKDLTYSVNSVSKEVVNIGFSSTDLVSKSQESLKSGQSNVCVASNGPLGSIVRYPLSDGDTDIMGEKVKDMGKQIGDFYYLYSLPQSSCSAVKAVSDLQQSTQPTVKAVYDSLEEM